MPAMLSNSQMNWYSYCTVGYNDEWKVQQQIDTDSTNKNDYSNSYTDTVEVEETFDNKDKIILKSRNHGGKW